DLPRQGACRPAPLPARILPTERGCWRAATGLGPEFTEAACLSLTGLVVRPPSISRPALRCARGFRRFTPIRRSACRIVAGFVGHWGASPWWASPGHVRIRHEL